MHARRLSPYLLFVALTVLISLPLLAQGRGGRGYVVVPDSTIEHATDIGVRAHTNHLIMVRPQFGSSSPTGETPSSIASVYSLPNPSNTPALNWSWNGTTIVIVDAYDYPTAESDLGVFSTQFGLPQCTTANGCFLKTSPTGALPRSNCGWAQEESLDIEWAHAMAPMAKIVLMEAASNSFSNLFTAVDAGTSYILGSSGGGKGQLSMSWGGSEFSSESSNDYHFQHAGVVYFGASGDTGGTTIYPSASPNVVAAGGTTIHRDKNGNFTGETGWSGSGGGPSKYEPTPSYQSAVASVASQVNGARGIPDFSFDADPNSGVSVYDSTRCQGLQYWLVFGGTSVSSPSLSGIVNLANHVTSSTTSISELTTIYNNLLTANFRDITSGTAGSYTAAVGWDFVTGVGSNLGLSGK